MQFAVDVQDTQILVKIEMVPHVCSIDHPVELKGMGLVPVLVPSIDEVFGAELLRVAFLVGSVRDRCDLCAEGRCEQQGKMTESTTKIGLSASDYIDLARH